MLSHPLWLTPSTLCENIESLCGCCCFKCLRKSSHRQTSTFLQKLEDPPLARLFRYINCGPRGGTGGAKPGSGVQRFWGPLGASDFDPSFQQFGVSETPSRGERRWATQRPLRGPVFPDASCPLRGSNPRLPTLRPQITIALATSL